MALNSQQYTYSVSMMPAVSHILQANAGLFVSFAPASVHDDVTHATDMQLSVTVADGRDIAVRVRQSSCTYRDLTIRSYSNGHKTELHKIKEGCARWYFYGWETGGTIDSYMIIDLDRLRASGLLDSRVQRFNKDQRTAFITISAQELADMQCICAYNNLPIKDLFDGSP